MKTVVSKKSGLLGAEEILPCLLPLTDIENKDIRIAVQKVVERTIRNA